MFHLKLIMLFLMLFKVVIAVAQEQELTIEEPQKLVVAGNYLSQLDEALPLFEKAYLLHQQVLGEKHPNTLTSLNNLAHAYVEQGHLEKSIGYFEQVVAGVESLRQVHLSAENRRAMFAQYTDNYSNLSTLYFAQNDYSAAFHTAEKTKARTLLESMAFKLALQQVNFTPDERQKLDQQQARLVFLNNKIVEAGNFEQRILLNVEKNSLLGQINHFHHQLKQKYPKFAKLSTPKIITAQQGQALLPPDAVFISYLQNPKTHELLVFTLDATGKLHIDDLGEIAGLAETLTIYRQALGTTIIKLRQPGKFIWQLADSRFVMGDKPSKKEKPRQVQHVDEISRYLATQLLQPIVAQLKTKSHWIISPSGGLTQIPFETLILDEQPVIANHAISYVQSLSSFALLKKREQLYQQLPERQKLFAMGNPRYHHPESPPKKCRNRKPAAEVDLEQLANDKKYQQTLPNFNETWCHLPGTQSELENLRQLYPNSTIYQQADASEHHLQQLNQQKQLMRYEYLYFATHSFLHPQTPALSALVLDQLDTTEQIDGYVTANEWMGYDLQSDLMVLSASQTGIGQMVSGEGILGLPYALYIAGNKNTLMSLWIIDDESTALFMKSFFSKLKQGIGPIDALTQTKREFINSQKYHHPLYWATFVLYGV